MKVLLVLAAVLGPQVIAYLAFGKEWLNPRVLFGGLLVLAAIVAVAFALFHL